VFAHGSGLDRGLRLPGTKATGTPARRGGPAAAASSAGVPQTPAAGGTRSFEEAEGSRLLLDRVLNILRGNPG
jgi:hypothetical protein